MEKIKGKKRRIELIRRLARLESAGEKYCSDFDLAAALGVTQGVLRKFRWQLSASDLAAAR